MHALSSVPSLDDPLFFKTEGHHYPKCRPSRMVPPFEPPPVQAGVLNSPIQPLDIGNAFANDVPAFSTKFYTTVVVKSTKDHTVLPHNANLGSIQPFNSNHEQVFSEAADHTAHTLADTWFEYAKHTGTTQNPSSVARSQAQPTGTSCFPQSWSLQAQTSEMTKSGLDSSYLSPFLPEPAPLPAASHVNPELCQVAYEFGKYLASLPYKTATASQACKQVYLSYPSAREILTRHGKLRGLIKACPYFQMDGEAHGGLYLLSLNQEAFRKLFPSL